jgi:molybdate transport system ATP-binding protein
MGLKLQIRHKLAGFEIDMCFNTKTSITGIFGVSGSGKSTMFNVIAGIISPDEGEINLNERILFSSSKNVNVPLHKRGVGLVFQDFKLFPHLSIKENLEFGKKAKNNSLFDRLVDMLNINHLLNRRPPSLSGGEKQRVAIGRAILSQPEILLLDEPFSALDVKIKNEIIDLIKEIPVRFNIPVLVISHELSDLLQLSSDLILIGEGKVLNHGNIYELFNHRPSIKLLSHSGLKNILELKVGFIDREKEMVCLSPSDGGSKIKVIINDLQPKLKLGNKVKLFLAPEDVAISLQPIDTISIQNKLKGWVENIFFINGKMICLIDCGLKILAEISRASAEMLQLEIRKEVWCLFKSVAPKII